MNVAKAKFLVVRRHWTQMGAKQEQERIIKLLEDDGERNYISQETFDYVVSIIKGESQKDNETVVLLTEGEINNVIAEIKDEK